MTSDGRAQDENNTRQQGRVRRARRLNPGGGRVLDRRDSKLAAGVNPDHLYPPPLSIRLNPSVTADGDIGDPDCSLAAPIVHLYASK